jgi:hypothetical protein
MSLRVCLETRSCGILLVLVVLLVLENPCKIEDEDENDDEDERLNRVSKQALRPNNDGCWWRFRGFAWWRLLATGVQNSSPKRIARPSVANVSRCNHEARMLKISVPVATLDGAVLIFSQMRTNAGTYFRLRACFENSRFQL